VVQDPTNQVLNEWVLLEVSGVHPVPILRRFCREDLTELSILKKLGRQPLMAAGWNMRPPVGDEVSFQPSLESPGIGAGFVQTTAKRPISLTANLKQ
jgi:hypothetical protein